MNASLFGPHYALVQEVFRRGRVLSGLTRSETTHTILDAERCSIGPLGQRSVDLWFAFWDQADVDWDEYEPLRLTVTTRDALRSLSWKTRSQ